MAAPEGLRHFPGHQLRIRTSCLEKSRFCTPAGGTEPRSDGRRRTPRKGPGGPFSFLGAFLAAFDNANLVAEYTCDSMPPRVVSLLLAFILLWSAAAMTQQRFAFAESPAQSQRQVTDESLHTNFSGSIDEHQVDDQPSQPHAEHVLDFAVLLDTERDRNGLQLAMIRPLQPVDVILPSPCLEGPQRPPCATSILPA